LDSVKADDVSFVVANDMSSAFYLKNNRAVTFKKLKKKIDLAHELEGPRVRAVFLNAKAHACGILFFFAILYKG
jgi:hypothetical protein